MAQRKRTSRSKKRTPRAPRGTPGRVKLLVVVMVLLLVGGIASVKFLQTRHGRTVLLDSGFTDYYALVQESVDEELRAALRELGLLAGLREKAVPLTVGKRRYVYRSWTVACGDPCPFVQINLAITKAVARAGGVIRSSREVREPSSPDPIALEIDVGSHRYTTHRLRIGRRPEITEPVPQPPDNRPRLALVFDDFGYSKSNIVRSILALDFPVTIAVIPTLRYSGYAVAEARAAGKQPILHLPMQAEEVERYDVPPVMTSMTDSEITALVERYLRETPGVIGVNNHMGSLATTDVRVMGVVLGVLKARHLFFLDSLTSSKSLAYTTAKQLGVPTERNDLFLDASTEDEAVVEERLHELVEIAKRRGSAVGIGHPKPWTYEAIKRSEPFLKDSGVRLVFLSEMVD
jgi:polysaccharide deacetylase 2 family uncharacterized protein YibQ